MGINKQMYKIARSDKEFMDEMKRGESNTPPSLFWGDELDFGMWASAYYGYLVGKYGVLVADELKREAKSKI